MRPILATGALLLLGCDSPTEPRWERRVAALYDVPDSSAAVTVPGMARVGQPVTVVVTTTGASDCTRAAGATVEVNGLVADIVPLDEEPYGSGVGCHRDLVAVPRPAQVTFLVPGEGVVRVTGFRNGAPAGLFTVERTIRVEP
jgi:hypothetical protein